MAGLRVSAAGDAFLQAVADVSRAVKLRLINNFPQGPRSLMDAGTTLPVNRTLWGWKVLLILAGIAVIAGLVQLHPLGRELDIQVLGCWGSSSVPRLLPFMQDSNDGVKLVALNRLSKIGPAAVPNLIAALHGSEATTRIDAIAVLSLLEINAGRQPEVCAAFSELLSDDNRLVQLAAIRGLASLDQFAMPALPQLMRKLEDDDSELRSNAVQTLVRVDPRSSQTLAAVIRQLKDPVPALRSKACSSLEAIGTRDPQAVDALIEALQDPAAAVREMAVDYLGEIGVAGLPAIPALQVLAEHDPDPNIRLQAAHAVQSVRESTP